MNTIFGQIIEGKLPAEKVFENDRIVAIKDINPSAPVHILIIPKQAVASIQQASADHLQIMPEVVAVAQQLAEKFGISDGYRLIINNGTSAGQTIFHWHFHLIGGRKLGPMA